MRIVLLALLILVSSSCMQTENSNSTDDDKFGGSGGSAEFIDAKDVFSSACSNCHDFHTMTEAELKATGRFVAGDPNSSPIYYRLTGSTGGIGPKNMPTSGAISSGDRNAIKVWIQNAN